MSNVEVGLKRWEIGEIAYRIAQLYFGQYMRTSEAGYSSESYVFYEAILSSYPRNEVKFSELTVDTFRMLQCLEWEPSGSFN